MNQSFSLIPFSINPSNQILSLHLPLGGGQSLATGQTLGLFFGSLGLHRPNVFSKGKMKENLTL